MNHIKTMKKLLFFFTLIITAGCSQAQNKAPKPNIDKIPAFHILNQDSVYVTNADLKKNKAVMIVYFSPDCSHCQRMMYEMKPHMKAFTNVQVVMVTFIQTTYLKLLIDFRKTYGLAAYPNFIMGTEYPDYALQRYFQVYTTPYIAIYDRKGKLVKAFDKVPKMGDLVTAVKGL
jgi:thioredoxin-related protein